MQAVEPGDDQCWDARRGRPASSPTLEFLMSRSKKIRTLAALGTLSGAAWAGTFASFTDSEGSAATFTAGTVNLQLDESAEDAHAFTALTVPNMKPGETKYAALNVKNPGSLGFRYTMASSTARVGSKPDLAPALSLQVNLVTAAADCNEDRFSTGTSVATTASPSSAQILSRPVVAGGNEVLCFQVAFPEGGAGDNAYQGAATTANLVFNATQS